MGDESATSDFEQRDPGQGVEEDLRETGAFAGLAEDQTQSPIILSFVVDRANLVSLLGLASGVLAIYFALRQNFPAAIIALLWAVLMDWFDGLVARRMPGRSESHKLVGARMDSLVDLVTSGTGYFHEVSELADTPYSQVCMSILLLEKGNSATSGTKLDLQDLPLDFAVDPALVK